MREPLILKSRHLTIYFHSDTWDTMFMECLVGGITMHQPLVPPRVVLTLGSGFGFWAIRAVQEWPVCVVVLYLGYSFFDPFDLVCSNAKSLHTVFLVCTGREWMPSYNQWVLPIV